MKLNNPGLNLIKTYEGWRDTAYLDAVGIWTIGYGHTAMAGPPNVKAGQKISKLEGEKILKRDVELFANGVDALIRQDLTDSQFSALVSLAYNIGLGAFGKSSALRLVNRGEFESVPRAIQLYTRAGGRVLAGLVKRRAAEAALFMTPKGVSLTGVYFTKLTPMEEDEIIATKGQLDTEMGKSLFGSTTNLAAMMTGLVATIQTAMWTVKDFLYGIELDGKTVGLITLTVVVIAAVFYIVSERRKKAEEFDV